MIAAIQLIVQFVRGAPNIDELFTGGNSLTECIKFAALFANTCGSQTTTIYDIASVPAQNLVCKNFGTCPGIVDSSKGECTFRRQLCVTCTEPYPDIPGNVIILVQTNTIPSHCIYSKISGVVPAPKDIFFTVKFNKGKDTTAADI